MASKLGAVVLAAGVSSRMGEFKPLLPIGGRTMIERVVGMMRRAGAGPVVVVTGYRSADLEEHLRGSGAEFVHNPDFARTQMFESVLLGLRTVRVRCGRILLCPADVPLVDDATVQDVLRCSGPFVRPVYRGRVGHPVALMSEIIPVLEAYRGEGGLRGAVENSGVGLCDLAVDDAAVAMDSDTAADYAELLRYHSLQTGRRQDLQVSLKVCLRSGELFWDPQSAQLLELIDATGSVQAACAAMHMACSQGAKMVNTIETHLGYKVIECNADGIGGGDSLLTARGKQLLGAYNALRRELDGAAEEVFRRHIGAIGQDTE